VAADYAEVQRHAQEAGRDPSSVSLSIRTRLPLKEPEQAIEILESYKSIGVSHAVIEVFTLDLERATTMMDVLANEVRPKVG